MFGQGWVPQPGWVEAVGSAMEARGEVETQGLMVGMWGVVGRGVAVVGKVVGNQRAAIPRHWELGLEEMGE